MATNFFKIKKGINVEPIAGSTVTAEGDLAYNDTSNKLEFFDNASAKSIVSETGIATLTNKSLSDSTVTFVDVSDPTKQVKIDAAGTTGTSTTLLSSQTTDRTITLPDATTTVVGTGATQTLSNKTFSDAITIAEIATPSTPPSGFGKIYFKSDNTLYALSDGGVESSATVGASTTRLSAIWTWVLGSAAQVTSGVATHSTWASVISAASAGDTIKVLLGTWTETVSINKNLFIEGSGFGSYLTGTITFTSASDYSCLKLIRCSDNITLDSGADGNIVKDIWLASGKTFIDNGDGNYLEGIQET